jgi:hypothetical protein
VSTPLDPTAPVPGLDPARAAYLSELAPFSALARDALGREPFAIEPLAGDVGRRRYFRLTFAGAETALGVFYPPEEADSRRRWIAAHGSLSPRVRVPRILADDGDSRQIVEDLGVEDLASRLSSRPAERSDRLLHAVAAAAAIAELPDPEINPPFDVVLFRRELDLAREAVFDLYLSAPLSDSERAAHDRFADALCREVLAHPRALCHRDYHGNNLFPFDGEVAAIDFQDLRLGPDTYDVASLLWERTTLDWMTPELARAAVAELARRRKSDPSELARRLDRVLLQRAWKVCGTFARAVAQGRGEAYRKYLPGEIALVGRLLSGSPEDSGFRNVYERRLAPLLS